MGERSIAGRPVCDQFLKGVDYDHPAGPEYDSCVNCLWSRRAHNAGRIASIREYSAKAASFGSHNHIAPPGLVGVLVLFVWIGALDRARQIEKMSPSEQPHARRGLAQWLWLNGVRGDACWTWGQG